jgi:nucleotide-binding universal stress UspA family protein
LSNSKNFSKILLAIDGSEPSMAAADYAISVAKKYGSDLIALHVIPLGTSVLGPPPHLIVPHLIEMKKEAQGYLDKIKQKASENENGIQLKTELITSPSIIDGILSFVEKEKIDLIVVGTKGRSGLKKLLLGSVASGIVTYAHCPVMIIR